MTLFERLRAQQKADKAKAEARREKRREYSRAAAERARLRRLADGLANLPAVLDELHAVTRRDPGSEPVQSDASVEQLIARLEAIKDRIFRLHAVFAVSLSQDAAIEANRYLTLFQDLAAELKGKQPEALGKIVANHEAMLLSPPVLVRQTIPIETQRFVELRWEALRSPTSRTPKRATDQIPDGLGWML